MWAIKSARWNNNVSKYVEYHSDECKVFLRAWTNNYDPNSPEASGFEAWLNKRDIIVNWGDDDRFLEFKNAQEKLLFLLKCC
jgi:hypothetical protein